jgi:hypothetical protein
VGAPVLLVAPDSADKCRGRSPKASPSQFSRLFGLLEILGVQQESFAHSVSIESDVVRRHVK